ncbi:MAG: metalloregulator ArsR/SmtB family transcription factor [bacterium]
MRDLETALKAAGDPTRTRILKLLEKSPLCVCQIQAVLDLAPSTISKHLALLKAAGLVVDRRDGKWVEYALAERSDNPYARPLLDLLRGPLDRDGAIRADRTRLRQVQAVPRETLCQISLPERRRD